MDDSITQPESAGEHQVRLDIARQIVKMFLPERLAYISLSALTGVLVIYLSFQVFHDSANRMAAAITLFGSGGIVAFNLSKLLTMFNTVIEKVFDSK